MEDRRNFLGIQFNCNKPTEDTESRSRPSDTWKRFTTGKMLAFASEPFLSFTTNPLPRSQRHSTSWCLASDREKRFILNGLRGGLFGGQLAQLYNPFGFGLHRSRHKPVQHHKKRVSLSFLRQSVRDFSIK
jgi:hypothetical protein